MEVKVRILTLISASSRNAGAFAGPDAEGDTAESPMGAGVAVSAHKNNARKGEPRFGADDVNDAMPFAVHRHIGDAMFRGVFLQTFDLGKRQAFGEGSAAPQGRNRVVRHGDMRLRTADLPSFLVERRKRFC